MTMLADIERLFELAQDHMLRTHLAEALRREAELATESILDDPTYGLSREEVQAGRNEGKIPAIKLYRNRTGKGLKESKDDVEEAFAQMGCDFFTRQSMNL